METKIGPEWCISNKAMSTKMERTTDTGQPNTTPLVFLTSKLLHMHKPATQRI